MSCSSHYLYSLFIEIGLLSLHLFHCMKSVITEIFDVSGPIKSQGAEFDKCLKVSLMAYTRRKTPMRNGRID